MGDLDWDTEPLKLGVVVGQRVPLWVVVCVGVGDRDTVSVGEEVPSLRPPYVRFTAPQFPPKEGEGLPVVVSLRVELAQYWVAEMQAVGEREPEGVEVWDTVRVGEREEEGDPEGQWDTVGVAESVVMLTVEVGEVVAQEEAEGVREVVWEGVGVLDRVPLKLGVCVEEAEMVGEVEREKVGEEERDTEEVTELVREGELEVERVRVGDTVKEGEADTV